ncbi:hypothetical protein [Radiobacillus sp. PE A8.2]|uniref:hypothetical protein n=1 Tax=Radiobacillus sp. PE A8.2 TaxID=3380349 RepID=UPI00388EF2DE
MEMKPNNNYVGRTSVELKRKSQAEIISTRRKARRARINAVQIGVRKTSNEYGSDYFTSLEAAATTEE